MINNKNILKKPSSTKLIYNLKPDYDYVINYQARKINFLSFNINFLNIKAWFLDINQGYYISLTV